MSRGLIPRIRALSVRSALKHLGAKRQLLFSKYLLVTNTGIAITLSGTGDVLEQHSHRQRSWNPVRTAHVASTGLIFGPMIHYWYIYLDRFLPGRTLGIIARKIAMNELVLTPVAISIYLSALSWLEGNRGHAIIEEICTKGPVLFKADCIVWPPAQLINFYFLPTRYRVLYDNTICLFFDIYYARVKYEKRDTETECDGEIPAGDIPNNDQNEGTVVVIEGLEVNPSSLGKQDPELDKRETVTLRTTSHLAVSAAAVGGVDGAGVRKKETVIFGDMNQFLEATVEEMDTEEAEEEDDTDVQSSETVDSLKENG